MLDRIRKAEKEVMRLGSRLLLASPDEKRRIKQRIIWLRNVELDAGARKIYWNAYKSIKV